MQPSQYNKKTPLILAVDNTFAKGPYYKQPLNLGADIVYALRLRKYLGCGISDWTGGLGGKTILIYR